MAPKAKKKSTEKRPATPVIEKALVEEKTKARKKLPKDAVIGDKKKKKRVETYKSYIF